MCLDRRAVCVRDLINRLNLPQHSSHLPVHVDTAWSGGQEWKILAFMVHMSAIRRKAALSTRLSGQIRRKELCIHVKEILFLSLYSSEINCSINKKIEGFFFTLRAIRKSQIFNHFSTQLRNVSAPLMQHQLSCAQWWVKVLWKVYPQMNCATISQYPTSHKRLTK